MRNCQNCKIDLKPKNKAFCSSKCLGEYRRGKAKGAEYQARNHTRILVDTGLFGKKRVYLHRHLVETHIRPLKEGEIVHHKDGNKFNNSLDNLEILEGQAKHLHLHDYYRGHRKSNKSESEMIAEIAEFGF